MSKQVDSFYYIEDLDNSLASYKYNNTYLHQKMNRLHQDWGDINLYKL